MLELEQAVARLLEAVPPPAPETVGVTDAIGRCVLEAVVAPGPLPPFDNSAMDGYAVRAADLVSAGSAAPVRLRLAGRVQTGDEPDCAVEPGTCARLFTGSPLPPGADAVVMQEDTRVSPERPGEVAVLEPVQAGENVRLRGGDVNRGTVIARAGEFLTAARASLLAAVGVARVTVGRRPSVAVLATGSELVEPGRPLGPGKIYESNRSFMAALCRAAGALPRVFPLVQDTLPATRQALAEAFASCDVVVTSGGASVGEVDLIQQGLAEIGGRLDFWRVAIKPGKPFIFGRRGGGLLFGLPGNPVSAFVTFLLLVRPALRRWQGAREIALPEHPGILAGALANPDSRRHFLRVRVDQAGKVTSAGLQGSHVLSSLAEANALVDLPPKTNLPAGSAVRVLRWEPGL
jgi:molybdopterin molybdotransferase